MQITANRLVALATAVLGVAAAIAVPAANLDWSSTAGVIAGIGAVAAAALKWLDGWQAHEQREHLDELAFDDQIAAAAGVTTTPVTATVPPDEGDTQAAEGGD